METDQSSQESGRVLSLPVYKVKLLIQPTQQLTLVTVTTEDMHQLKELEIKLQAKVQAQATETSLKQALQTRQKSSHFKRGRAPSAEAEGNLNESRAQTKTKFMRFDLQLISLIASKLYLQNPVKFGFLKAYHLSEAIGDAGPDDSSRSMARSLYELEQAAGLSKKIIQSFVMTRTTGLPITTYEEWDQVVRGSPEAAVRPAYYQTSPSDSFNSKGFWVYTSAETIILQSKEQFTLFMKAIKFESYHIRQYQNQMKELANDFFPQKFFELDIGKKRKLKEASKASNPSPKEQADQASPDKPLAEVRRVQPFGLSPAATGPFKITKSPPETNAYSGANNSDQGATPTSQGSSASSKSLKKRQKHLEEILDYGDPLVPIGAVPRTPYTGASFNPHSLSTYQKRKHYLRQIGFRKTAESKQIGKWFKIAADRLRLEREESSQAEAIQNRIKASLKKAQTSEEAAEPSQDSLNHRHHEEYCGSKGKAQVRTHRYNLEGLRGEVGLPSEVVEVAAPEPPAHPQLIWNAKRTESSTALEEPNGTAGKSSRLRGKFEIFHPDNQPVAPKELELQDRKKTGRLPSEAEPLTIDKSPPYEPKRSEQEWARFSTLPQRLIASQDDHVPDPTEKELPPRLASAAPKLDSDPHDRERQRGINFHHYCQGLNVMKEHKYAQYQKYRTEVMNLASDGVSPSKNHRSRDAEINDREDSVLAELGEDSHVQEIIERRKGRVSFAKDLQGCRIVSTEEARDDKLENPEHLSKAEAEPSISKRRKLCSEGPGTFFIPPKPWKATSTSLKVNEKLSSKFQVPVYNKPEVPPASTPRGKGDEAPAKERSIPGLVQQQEFITESKAKPKDPNDSTDDVPKELLEIFAGLSEDGSSQKSLSSLSKQAPQTRTNQMNELKEIFELGSQGSYLDSKAESARRVTSDDEEDGELIFNSSHKSEVSRKEENQSSDQTSLSHHPPRSSQEDFDPQDSFPISKLSGFSRSRQSQELSETSKIEEKQEITEPDEEEEVDDVEVIASRPPPQPSCELEEY